MIKYNCSRCNTEFEDYESNHRQYCSLHCAAKSRTVWNKGLKTGRLSAETKQKMMGRKNSWKGGRINRAGYVAIFQPNHPKASSIGYVREHILVMEKHIGRYMANGEVIHHLDGIKDNNKIENLHLFGTQGEHMDYHAMLRCFVRQELKGEM